MWMMFIYVNDKAYNSMGIRKDDLVELAEIAKQEIEVIKTLTPLAKVEIKMEKYI